MSLATWTFGFWQAWLYLGVSLAAGAAMLAYLQRADPDLLRRRLRGPMAERATSQKLIQVVAELVFAGMIGLSILDHHFSWSRVPFVGVLGGETLLATSFLIIFLAFRENTYAAVNIAVEPGQQVISTGPYAAVRHPYYSGLLIWCLATPLALGSWWGLLMFVPIAIVIAFRIRYEEQFLAENLPGYAEYCRIVRYRLLPLVW